MLESYNNFIMNYLVTFDLTKIVRCREDLGIANLFSWKWGAF